MEKPAPRRRVIVQKEKVERLVVSLANLETGRNPLSLSADLARLGLDEWFKPLSPLDLDGYVDRFGDVLTIRGQAMADLDRTCSRCAVSFRGRMKAEVFALCDREGADDEKMSQELEQDGHLVYHDGQKADITDVVCEAIILAEPMNPLCREDCLGLCPRCGADLNTESCRCSGQEINPRWSALEKLRERKDS